MTSRFKSLGSVRAMCVACTIAVCVPASTVVTGSERLDNFARALDLLGSAYPELRNRGLGVTLASNYWRTFDAPLHPLRSFALVIGEPFLSSGPHAAHDDVKELFRAHFEFAADDRLESVSMSPSRVINSDGAERIDAVVARYSDLTKPEGLAALRKAGAKFGPADAQELRLSVDKTLARLTAVLGVTRVTSSEWVSDGGARWRVTFTARHAGKTIAYRASFEPLHGKLTGIQRTR